MGHGWEEKDGSGEFAVQGVVTVVELREDVDGHIRAYRVAHEDDAVEAVSILLLLYSYSFKEGEHGGGDDVSEEVGAVRAGGGRVFEA